MAWTPFEHLPIPANFEPQNVYSAYLVAWQGVYCLFETVNGRVSRAAPVCGPIKGLWMSDAVEMLTERGAWVDLFTPEAPSWLAPRWPRMSQLAPYQSVRR